MLAASLGSGLCATILVAGAGGTANEILTAGSLEPNWRFVAVDPSQAMVSYAVEGLTEAGLSDRTETFLGVVDDLPSGRQKAV
jgi:tRNA (cmo5U34)-methyltransferase